MLKYETSSYRPWQQKQDSTKLRATSRVEKDYHTSCDVSTWLDSWICHKEKKSFIIISLNLRKRRNETSGYVRLRKSAEILVLGPSCVPAFEYLPWLAC